MVQVRRALPGLVPQLVLALAVFLTDTAQARKFYPDDPIHALPKRIPANKLQVWKTTQLHDFLRQSVRQAPRPEVPTRAINTLGEVPDNEWFTSRHGVLRMTREQLQRGPGADLPPVAPFTVVGAKTDGITPGFRMTDATGQHLYYIKPDPMTNPEMATAADVIGSRFFYAIGYNTPENYLIHLKRSDLKVSPSARVEGLGGKKRAMLERDLDDILRHCPRRNDGTYRMVASLSVPGKSIGNFRYEGTRSDDPNDTVPHEHRRDLRGLRVFCAWLNHTDAKAFNSVDAVVEEDGIPFVRHYLIDFGSILGSDSDMAKNARFGNEYVIPKGRQVLERMFLFGLDVRPWERAGYGRMKAVGRLESSVFDPENWRPNYPNPAFLARLPDDEYWAAKIVTAFSDEDIRAIVETGQYSDPRVVDYVTARLVERRNKILRAYLTKVLALDHFRIEDGELKFDDLAVKLDYVRPRQYQVAWARFDNETERSSPIEGAKAFHLPQEAAKAQAEGYYAATIRAQGEPAKAVTVYVQTGPAAPRVVGIERMWR
jgi:hypothetical protein